MAWATYELRRGLSWPMFLEVQVQDQKATGLGRWQGKHVRVHSSESCKNRGSAHISCQDREKGKGEGNRIPFNATLLTIWRLL